MSGAATGGSNQFLLADWSLAHFLSDGVLVEGSQTSDEDDHPYQGHRQQPAGVETQPGEVDGNFLSEVISDVVQWLIFVPPPPPSPVLVQDLSSRQFLVIEILLCWPVKCALR